MNEFDGLDLADIIEQNENLATSQPADSAGMQFDWEGPFLREILGLMLTDRVFFTTAYSVVKSDYFKDKFHRKICGSLFGFYKQYNTVPTKNQLHQFLVDSMKEDPDEDKIRARSELHLIYDDFIPGINTRDYYRDKLVSFAKAAELRIAFRKSLDMISKDQDNSETWDKVYSVLQKALAIQPDFDIGLDYFGTAEERYERMMKEMEDGEIFTVGFPGIDRSVAGGGPKKGQLMSVMGLSGTGKSLWLASLAVENLNLGKKVLYISLELDEDSISQRFDAQIANPTGDPSKVGLMEPLPYKDEVVAALADYVSNFDDPNRLVIKQFPGGTMGMSELRAYYQQVVLHGFQPDVLIVDYVGEMKDLPGMKIYESRYALVRDLRGFAVEEDIFCATAMQPNRSAKEQIKLGEVISDENLGDSYDQVRPLDLLVSINQTSTEKKVNVARAYITKNRFGRDKFIVYIEYDPHTLKLREISFNEYNTRVKAEKQKEKMSTDDYMEANTPPKSSSKASKAAESFIDGFGGSDSNLKNLSFGGEPTDGMEVEDATPSLDE